MSAIDFDDYEMLASRTLGDSGLAILGLGIAGESGEVAEVIKKHLGHGHPLDQAKLAKELGDVLWYVAMIARVNGIPLRAIAQRNIDKLKARYPDGFSSDRSVNRTEE